MIKTKGLLVHKFHSKKYGIFIWLILGIYCIKITFSKWGKSCLRLHGDLDIHTYVSTSVLTFDHVITTNCAPG